MKAATTDIASRLRRFLPPRHTAYLTPEGAGRPLKAGEIRVLEAKGNHCVEWSLVTVTAAFDPTLYVRNVFVGRLVLGGHDDAQSGPPSAAAYPRGVYDSTLSDVRLGDNVTIHRCPLIQGYAIGGNSVVAASTLRHRGHGSFGNGTPLSPGVETGGRPFRVAADLDLETAQLVLERPNAVVVEAYDEFLQEYVALVQSPLAALGESCLIENTITVESAWVGPGATITGAQQIKDSTILSEMSDPTYIGSGAMVEESAIQEGCRVDHGGCVFSSLVMEHVTCGVGAKVIGSILGPNCAVESGEVNASFVGPFVAMHHESLVIAAFWPGGRGNVGYGANIGSNHTSRVPDQEILPAEGMFFGLGCSVTYPANFSRAPYTVIGTGVTTLPQRMEFPFSLITRPRSVHPECSPAINRLIPAWMLSENLYALLRNEKKFQARNRARRNSFDFDIFTPATLEWMKTALRRLEDIAVTKTLYMKDDIPGLGRNLLLEDDRLRAIETYRFFLEYRELRDLAQQSTPVALDACVPQELKERAGALSRLKAMAEEIHRGVTRSREKDYARGGRIMEDYGATHPPIEDDEFLQTSEKDTQELQRHIEGILDYIERIQP